MNISDNNINLNNFNIANTSSGKTNAAAGGNSAVGQNPIQNVSGNALITQVNEGQLFNGKILDITRDQVSILLNNNKTLLAHMTDNINFNIGDAITFQVQENNGSNVVIKPYQNSAGMMKDNAIFKVLDTNNFAPTEKNYMIAEKLMNNNMPVDKASMQKIMQLSYKYPDANIDTLLNMTKLGINIDSNSINQYEAFLSNNHQLMSDLVNMSGSITEFSATILDGMDLSNGNISLDNILQFNNTLLGALSDASDVGDLSNILPDVINPNNADGTLDLVAPQNTSVIANEGKAYIMENLPALAEKFSIQESSINQLVDSLNKIGFDDTTIAKLLDNSDTPMKLMNNIKELLNSDVLKNDISQTNDNLLADIKNMLQSEGYKELLDVAVKKKFSLDPNKMENPKEIDDLYNSIYDKANRLMDAFSGQGGSAGKNMQESAKGMQERIDFMQNLNNMFTYAQIPVNVSGSDMNSELFVYMNKKRMKDAKEEVSALLHLDMDHLGPTDVHVSLRGTTVNTRFYVEDEESARIIDEHMTMLEKAINESGYSLINEVVTREPSIGKTSNMVIDEMLNKDMEKSVKRYSFDVRT